MQKQNRSAEVTESSASCLWEMPSLFIEAGVNTCNAERRHFCIVCGREGFFGSPLEAAGGMKYASPVLSQLMQLLIHLMCWPEDFRVVE